MVRLVVLAALAAVGFGAGRWIRSEPADVVPVTASVRHAPKAGDACDQLASVEAQLARTRDTTEGIPSQFPDDPALQPAEFHRSLDEARRACPEMVVDHVDCDEYPCLAWVRDPCGAACEPLRCRWSDIDELTLGDGTPSVLMTVWLPSKAEGVPSRDYSANGTLRLATRTERAREAIVASGVARSMTSVELWTASIRTAEQRLEGADNPDSRAHWEAYLPFAHAELERALLRERGP